MSHTQFTSARSSATRNLLLALVTLAVAACTMQPVNVPPPGNAQALQSRARTEAANGNFAVAAELYAQIAAAMSGTQRVDFLLESARLSIEAGDLPTARRRIGEVRANASREQQQQMTVLLARLEAEQGRPQVALDMLAQLQQPIGVVVLRDAAAVRGRALFRLGRPADAVRALVEREVWLDDAAQIRANQQLIWDGFREPSLPSAFAPTGDSVVDGWLALAPLARAGGSDTDLRRSLLAWRETYTDHPAAGGILAELLAAQRAAGFPAQIALLLPLSSPQRIEAHALRDGFLAAHLRNSRSGDTSIRVYDTAALGAGEAYLRAQLEGADFIVGPLLRPEVDQVSAQAGFVPTLALNFAQNETPVSGSFYQFALAPADEARAVARYAAAGGASTAVALVPSNERGYQLRDAFRAEFEALGGRLLAFSGYDAGSQNFAGQITSLFNLSASTQRYRRLAANLGTPIQFEPRRRQDVDLIFLVADSQAGKLLAPQLRFHSVGDLPTYATSQIFEPGGAGRDNDLNGVIFPDAPAILTPDQTASSLRSELALHWPQRAGQARLYGMGYDAYQLVGSLYEGNGSSWPMRGLSGELMLYSDGRIHRDLPLAQFRNGRPVALEPAARSREGRELVGFR